MKRKIAIISAVVLLMTAFFIGCGKSEESESTDSGATAVQTPTSEAQSQKPMATPPISNSVSVGLVYSGTDYETELLKLKIQTLMAVSSIQISVTIAETAQESPLYEIEGLVGNGCEIIFVSGVEDKYVIEAALQYPSVYFEVYGGTEDGELNNVSLFYPRFYQQQYLNGMIAGFASETGSVGYISLDAENSDVRRVNAFALGAKAVNPEAVVHFAWTGEISEIGYEREIAGTLCDENCDVIYKAVIDQNIIALAEEKNILLMGKSETGSDTVASALEPDIFEYILSKARSVASMTYQKNDDDQRWIGIGSYDLNLDNYNMLAEDQKAMVLSAADKMRMRTWDVFTGPITDVYGQTIIPEGETIPDEDLLHMLWYVGNIKALAPPMG